MNARACLLAALAGFLLLVPAPLVGGASGGDSQANQVGQVFPSASWALGVVVPEGARLQGGGDVSWGTADNVTAVMRLPNITLPDRVVYAVMSLMTSDRAVLQVAAGAYPNRSVWLAYSWSVPSLASQPLTYHWVLNGSGPEMAPMARVSASIYKSSGGWNLKVVDLDTGSSVDQPFPPGASSPVMVGDQEVFALESYSRTGTTFQDMGNLTLERLMIDGEQLVGGAYSYGSWDPLHDPVFVVGSAGASPPGFVSFNDAGNGSYSWGYARVWGNEEVVFENGVLAVAMVAAIVLGVVGAVFGVTVAMKRVRTRAAA